MATLLQRLIKSWRKEPPAEKPKEAHEKEEYQTGWDAHPVLTRQRREDLNIMGRVALTQYHYWCACGTPLRDGPRGGMCVNAVCKKCNLNYGNIPGYWGC